MTECTRGAELLVCHDGDGDPSNMSTPAAKKPAKKTTPADGSLIKKSKQSPEVPSQAAVAPEAGVAKAKKAPAVKAEETPKPKKAPVKKAKAEAEVAVVTPLLVESEAPKVAADKPARGRKPAKAKPEGDEAPAAAAPEVEAPMVAPPKAAGGFPTNAEIILNALRDGRPLEFIFLDGDANPPRTFEPRQLIFDTLAQAWFVWGWDRRYNAERHHRLDALAELNQVEGMGRSAQGPYKEGTPPNLLGGWLGGEAIPVKATLMKQWIFAVKQAPPAFPDFKLTDAEDGKATVTFTATDLRAIARWCMQFGDGIQVQEPQRLIDRIKQAGIAWAGKPVATAAPAPASKPAHRQDEPKREPRREDRHREERHETRRDREAAAGGDAHPPKSGPKGASSHATQEREYRPADGGRREESKPAKANPKVEVRVERL